MFRTRTSPIFAAGLLLAAPAFGQEEVVEKSATVASGETTRIGVFGRVTPECTSGPVEVRLEERPSHGETSARKAVMTTDNIPNCPEIETNVAVVFYRSDQGYRGADTMVIEVETDDGQLQRHEYSITVE